MQMQTLLAEKHEISNTSYTKTNNCKLHLQKKKQIIANTSNRKNMPMQTLLTEKISKSKHLLQKKYVITNTSYRK